MKFKHFCRRDVWNVMDISVVSCAILSFYFKWAYLSQLLPPFVSPFLSCSNIQWSLRDKSKSRLQNGNQQTSVKSTLNFRLVSESAYYSSWEEFSHHTYENYSRIDLTRWTRLSVIEEPIIVFPFHHDLETWSNNCARSQGNSDGSSVEVDEAAPSAPPSQDDQQGARPQGGLRLRHDLAEERVQHPHRLHPLPAHLRHGRRPAVQREVLLLQRPV